MRMASDELRFRANDPGAVKLGNFINYYQFHPSDQRMKNFPNHLWHSMPGQPFLCLDIGCNTGNLTKELFEFLSKHLTVMPDHPSVGSHIVNDAMRESFILALDIDPNLINTAENTNIYKENIFYQSLDFMNLSDRKEALSTFLNKHGDATKFDVIFCFSVTMWIHLNHGDEGLKSFLVEVTRWTNMIVIEPQPWKCYRSAVRRLKRATGETFPLYTSLKMRENVEENIVHILHSECGFKKVLESAQSPWQRRILIFKRDTVFN